MAIPTPFRVAIAKRKNENVLKSVTIDGAVCKRGNSGFYVTYAGAGYVKLTFLGNDG